MKGGEGLEGDGARSQDDEEEEEEYDDDDDDEEIGGEGDKSG